MSRTEVNIAADAVELSPEQIDRLNRLQPAAGACRDPAGMAILDR